MSAALWRLEWPARWQAPQARMHGHAAPPSLVLRCHRHARPHALLHPRPHAWLLPRHPHPFDLKPSRPTLQTKLQAKEAAADLVYPYSRSYERTPVASIVGTADGGRSLVGPPAPQEAQRDCHCTCTLLLVACLGRAKESISTWRALRRAWRGSQPAAASAALAHPQHSPGHAGSHMPPCM